MSGNTKQTQSHLTVAHILPPAVQAAAGVIRDWRRNQTKYRFRELFLTQLSTFFDPFGPGVDDLEKEICFKSVVSIAVVNGSKKGRMVMAFLEGAADTDSEVQAFLSRRGVPVMLGGLGDANRVRRFMDEHLAAAMAASAVLPGTRPVISKHERWMLTEIQEVLGTRINAGIKKDWKRFLRPQAKEVLSMMESHSDSQKQKFFVYPEVSLGELVCVRNGAKAGNDLAQKLSRLRSYRCDAVVVTPGAYGRPLFVVEDDDETHDNPQKGEKDAWRDKMLTDAGLAVLRISHRNPNLAEGSPSAQKREFRKFMQFVVRELAEALYQVLVIEKNQVDPYWARVSERVLADKADWLSKNGEKLGRDDALCLFEAAMRQVDKEDPSLRMDRFLEQELYLDMFRSQSSLTEIDSISNAKLHCLNDEVILDKEGASVFARAELEWTEDGHREEIATQRFFCRLNLPRQLREEYFPFEEILAAGAKYVLLDKAAKLAKANA